MAYYTTNGGQVLVPSPQYISNGSYPTAAKDRQVPFPGKYAVAYSKSGSIGIGVFLILCGAAAMAGSAIAFKYHAALSDIGAGLWCGAMFVAVGSISIAAGCHLTDTLIIATTVTSGFNLIFSIALITMSSVGLSQDLDYFNCYQYCNGNTDYYYCACYYEDWQAFAIAANSVMIGAGAVSLILSFWLFVICCVGLCRTSTTQTFPMPVQYVQNSPQMMTTSVIPNQQTVPMPVQYVQNSPQMMTTSVIPNQQVLSVPVQFVQLSAAQNQLPTGSLQIDYKTPDNRQPEKYENLAADLD